jgi:hypothetical protein
VLRRRVRLLVAATITYNVVEAVVALGAGVVAGSVALIGFGLDSVVEVGSAAAVAWQFAGPDPDRRERVALRVVAFSFLALAAIAQRRAGRELGSASAVADSTHTLPCSGGGGTIRWPPSASQWSPCERAAGPSAVGCAALRCGRTRAAAAPPGAPARAARVRPDARRSLLQPVPRYGLTVVGVAPGRAGGAG